MGLEWTALFDTENQQEIKCFQLLICFKNLAKLAKRSYLGKIFVE